MRRTRHVILPVRSWQYIGFLIVSLACLTFGLVSRDREGHAGSLAGPELNHLAPHDVDACPNLNKLTDVPSCVDSRYDRNFVLRKSWSTEGPGHSRASSRKLPRGSRTQNRDRRSESRLQEGRDSRKTERVAMLNVKNRTDTTRRFFETRSRVKDFENRRSIDPTTRRARSLDESTDDTSRSYERRSRITGFGETKDPARVKARVEVDSRMRDANQQGEIFGTRDRRQRFRESRRVDGPRESRNVRRTVDQRSLDLRRSRMPVVERRSRSVETLRGKRDISLNRRSLTHDNLFDERRKNVNVDRRENRDARINRQSLRTAISRDSLVNRNSRMIHDERRTRSLEREENNNIVRRENRETEATRRSLERFASRDSSMRRNSRMNLNERSARFAERRENRETLVNRRSLERVASRDSSMRRNSVSDLNERRSRTAERRENQEDLANRRALDRTIARNPSANRISRSDLNNRRSRSVEQRDNNNIVRREKREARTDQRSLERLASRDSSMGRNSRSDLNERRSRTIERRVNREARTDQRSLERLASRDSSMRRNSRTDLDERRSRTIERRVNREARTDRRSLERLASRDSSMRRNSRSDLDERRSRTIERRENREARTDRRSLERLASRNSSMRRNSQTDLDERRSRTAERQENREARTDRRSLERFASRDSSMRRKSRSDLDERRSRSRVLVLRSVDRRTRVYQEKRATRNSLPLSLERSKSSDPLSRSVERRETINLARQNSNKRDNRRSLNERDMRRVRNERVSRNRSTMTSLGRRSIITSKSAEPTTLVREEKIHRFARIAQALDTRTIALLKSMELEKYRDNHRSASQRTSEKRFSARINSSARKADSSENVREKTLTERVERRVDLPVLKNTRDSRQEVARSVHRRSIELFKNNLSRSNAKLYREVQDSRTVVPGNTANILRKLAINDNGFNYETIPFPTYEIIRQTAIMTLCAAYAMHIYNGKGSSIWNVFERMGRFMV